MTIYIAESGEGGAVASRLRLRNRRLHAELALQISRFITGVDCVVFFTLDYYVVI